MGRYIVVKGLPIAIHINKNFLTGKIKFEYQGNPLFEITKGEVILDFPDGTKKTMTYKKSILGFEYPRIFIDGIEIIYLIALTTIQKVITALPAVIILTNGLLGLAFALILGMLFTKIYRSIENMILATTINLILFVVGWVIANILSIYLLGL
jgi:hypothetical protein